MRVGGARHGNAAATVAQAVIGLVLDGCMSRFLMHSRFEAATLDHELVDYAMKQGISIKALAYVSQEIFNSFRRLFRVNLENDGAEVGFHVNHSKFLVMGIAKNR